MPATLGPIVRLQIQLSKLKVGEKPHRTYYPDSVLSVERLRVSREGILGITPEAELMDVHHARHPFKKNEDLKNGISVGFTGHYSAMQERFGPHMAVGVAGENIIVEAPRRVTLDETARGFVVTNAKGREKGRLVRVLVATPCRPFTGFALKGATVAPEVMKDSLAFLDGGTRGFYCGFDGPDLELELGDVLALA
jgi:hypothetical protein